MRVSVKADEWWGGAVADGKEMPFGTVAHRRNLATSAGFADEDNSGSNQSAPLLVSSAGRYVWSDQPFSFALDGDGGLELDGDDIVLAQEGEHAYGRVPGCRRPPFSSFQPHAGRADVHGAAVQHVDRDASCALRSWSRVLPPARSSCRQADGKAAMDQ
jgi:hypothetical protein